MLRLIFGCLVFALVRQSFGQPSPQTTHIPKYEAPNPPACAVSFTDFFKDITNTGLDIVGAMGPCARRMGWYGQTPYGDKNVWPLDHNQQTCTLIISAILSDTTDAMTDIFSNMYVCWNNNQGCAQAAMSAINCFMGAMTRASAASFDCETPGENAPFNPVNGGNLIEEGWACWTDVWGIIYKLIKAAKYIDVAAGVCPVSLPAPAPEPVASPQQANLGFSPIPHEYAKLEDVKNAEDAERRLSDSTDVSVGQILATFGDTFEDDGAEHLPSHNSTRLLHLLDEVSDMRAVRRLIRKAEDRIRSVHV